MSFIISQYQCSINGNYNVVTISIASLIGNSNASQIFAGNMKAKADDLKQ